MTDQKPPIHLPLKPTLHPHAPPWLGPLNHRRQVDRAWLTAAILITLSNGCFFGYRGMWIMLLSVVATAAIYSLFRIRSWLAPKHRPVDSISNAVTQALLLGAMLPMTTSVTSALLGGAVLGACLPWSGRSHRIRIPPCVLALMLSWAISLALGGSSVADHLPNQSDSVPTAVLRCEQVFRGDVYDAHQSVRYTPWWEDLSEVHHAGQSHDAIGRWWPYLIFLKEQKRILEHPTMLTHMMASGELPRIEELLIGCVPGLLGATSQGLLICLGLYLMYRRLSWWSMPIVTLLGGLGTLLAMPIRATPHWTAVYWLLLDMPMAVWLTYLGYFFLTSPMILIAFILAPAAAPISTHGRLVYCLFVGSLTVVVQWFFPIPTLVFTGVLLGGLFSPLLDYLHPGPGRTIVSNPVALRQ